MQLKFLLLGPSGLPLAVAAFATLLSMCASSGQSNSETMQRVPQSSSRPPVAMRLPDQQRANLIANAQKVRIEMTANQVIALLGIPKYDYVLGPKVETKGNQDKFHRILTYPLAEYGGGGNTADEAIGITFDRKGSGVLKISFTNVAEFHNDSYACETYGKTRECSLKK